MASKTIYLVLFSFFVTTLWLGSSALADQTPTAQDSLLKELGSAEYAIPSGLSEEELEWYIKFQEGNLIVDGWQDIAADILSRTPADELAVQEKTLQELGVKIGMEWCKDNDIRKVNNDMLKEWGKQLKVTAKENPEDLDNVLAGINSELESLLN